MSIDPPHCEIQQKISNLSNVTQRYQGHRGTVTESMLRFNFLREEIY
jgi:hypothetical protein